MVLALEDFQITAVDNGIDAIARARELRPDLVLADVLMPGRSGYEVCETLKSDPATAGHPGAAPGRQLRAVRRGPGPRRPRRCAHHQALREPGLARPGPDAGRVARRAADDAAAPGHGHRAAPPAPSQPAVPRPSQPMATQAPRPAATGAFAPVAAQRPAPTAGVPQPDARPRRHPAPGGPRAHADGRGCRGRPRSPSARARHPAPACPWGARRGTSRSGVAAAAAADGRRDVARRSVRACRSAPSPASPGRPLR